MVFNEILAGLTPAEDKYLPNASRDGGICLALSGGGFRATLFHLGGLRRLNELALLGSVKSISSVSGGSVMALCLADAMISVRPEAGKPLRNFEDVARKVHEITSVNLRRIVILKKLFPWKSLRSLPQLIAAELEDRVSTRSLADLPDHPRFVF